VIRYMDRALKIIVAHNLYQHRGGEDTVVEAEVALLRSAGHEVHVYERHNSDLQSASGLKKMGMLSDVFWSRRTVSDFTNLIDDMSPDVIHVHNTLPLISPSIYWIANRRRVPVVQTLHNFRLLCPQALLLRDGKVCELCLNGVPWQSIRFGCYRSSRVETAAIAGTIQLHRTIGTWSEKVAKYIALNEFCREKFVAGGIPPQKIVVKPNFIDLDDRAVSEREGLLFVGRLSHEKGISVLRDCVSYLESGVGFDVIGSGPEESLLSDDPRFYLHGQKTQSEVHAAMFKARALVLPSIWYENFPRTIVEAFACGLPVIASDLGAMRELVKHGVTGLRFVPGDSQDLARQINFAQSNPEKMIEMGKNARQFYENNLTGSKNISQLVEIYRSVIY
jgi:glycosyltransferase involved in cell wall biosynthesis